MTILLDLLWSLALVGISLYLGLSLSQQKPAEHPAAVFPLWFLTAVAHWAAQNAGLSALVYFPAGLLLTGIVRLIFRTSWLYAGTAAMLSLSVLEVSELLCLAGTPRLIVLAVLLLLALLTRQGAALLPEDTGIMLTGEQRRAVQFNLRMVSILAAVAAVQLWLCGLLVFESRLTCGELWFVLTASVVLCGLLLLLIRFVSFGTMQRVEAVMDKQYQAELLNLMQVIRSQRHDFNIHIQTLAGMLERENYGECRAYLSQMLQLTNAMNDILPLHDPAVSAMLNSFREIAVQKHIAMEVSITDNLEHTPCTVYEINTIIGNLLQNAIDEVDEQPECWVRVSILKRGGKHIVKVTNPCTASPDDLAQIFQPGFTTKLGHSGIGLATVERIVTKCGGSVHPEWNHDALSMIVRLPSIQTKA